MTYFKYIKVIFITIFTLLIGFFLSLFGFRRGQINGMKKMQKEIKRVEEKRQKIQTKVDDIHNNAVRQAMATTDTNSIDTFNRMFNDKPPTTND